MAKKKKKKGKKKHPHAAHKKPHHKKKKKAAHSRCPACGHSARHDSKAGCLHQVRGVFCPCKHR